MRRIVAIDIAVGDSGITAAAWRDGSSIRTREWQGGVEPVDAWKFLVSLYPHSVARDRLLVVERPYLTRDRRTLEQALDLAEMGGRWQACGSLLGARITTPTAQEWRDVLRTWLRARRRPIPRTTQQWKAVAVEYAASIGVVGVSHHACEAFAMLVWAENALTAPGVLAFGHLLEDSAT